MIFQISIYIESVERRSEERRSEERRSVERRSVERRSEGRSDWMCVLVDRAETERGLSRKHIIEG